MKINRNIILILFNIILSGMFFPFLISFSKECIINYRDIKNVIEQYENIIVTSGIIKRLPDLSNKIQFLVVGRIDSKTVINGKKDWLFYTSVTDGNLLADYEGKNYPSEQEFKIIKTTFINNYEYLKTRGIKFVLLIAPNKGNIYREYLPKSIKQANKMTTEYIVEKLQSEITSFPIIYPYEEFVKLHSKYLLFYPRDTHWNQLGSYIAYRAIMSNIFEAETKSLEELKIIEKVGKKGDLVEMLRLNDYFPSMTEYYIKDYKTSNNNIKTLEKDKSVLVIIDSYGYYLVDYLKKSFRNINFVHRHKYMPSDLDKYKPDIVIFETVGRYLNHGSCLNFSFYGY